MKWIAFITFGVIMTTSNAFASGDSWDEDELAILVPIVTVAALFTFLTLRHYFESRVQRAAIEQGQPIPIRTKRAVDERKAALILIAAGLGYGIAAYVHVTDSPQAYIWGIIPLLIGIGLLVFHYMKAKDKKDDKEFSVRPELAP